MTRSFPQRKSPRLQGCDYSQSGAYFVTICAHGHVCIFGDIQNGIASLSPIGEIAAQALVALPALWQSGSVDPDFYVVMPDHVHLILLLHSPDAQKRVPTPGMVVGNYKGGVTREARKQGFIEPEGILWQSRYHDHIIRNEDDLHRIRHDIENNPSRWSDDTFYPDSQGGASARPPDDGTSAGTIAGQIASTLSTTTHTSHAMLR